MVKKTVKKPKETTEVKPKHEHGKKYQAVAQLVNREEVLQIDQLWEELEKTKVTAFDPTVEIHVNLQLSGIRGNINLPGGTAKKKRVLVITDANLEDEVKKIESGKIEFDVLVVKPEMMPKIAKLAKKLGPKGLMPNPKSGTVTENPEKIVEEIESGRIEYKQDKGNVIHLPVGKLSFGKDKILSNIKEVIKAMPANKVNSAFVNLTMGPSLKLNVSKKK